VYEAARRAPDLGDVLVATDSPDVVDACAKFGVPTMLTSPEHPSGTDRIWEVAQSRAADVYVNVQGDEPLLTPEHIRLLVSPFRDRPATQVEGGLAWDDTNNNRAFHAGEISATLNGASIYIVAKRQKDKIKDDKGEPLYQDIEHAALMPKGPAGQFAL